MSPMDVWTMVALVASVGAGVCAGAFFAFSSFVMPALGALPPSEAIGAMQAINRAAPRPSFMAVLFGPGLLLVALLVGGGEPWQVPRVWGAAGLYLFGVVGMTALWHVPLNNGLDRWRVDLKVADDPSDSIWLQWFGPRTPGARTLAPKVISSPWSGHPPSSQPSIGLEKVSVSVDDAAAVWARYDRRWTTWNHARGLAAALTCGLLGVGVL